MIHERQKSGIISDVFYLFGYIERRDIAQEAELLMVQDPEIHALRLKSRIIDEFRTRHWQHSYRGVTKHKHYGVKMMEEDQPSHEPEGAYSDTIMAEWVLERLFPDERELLHKYFWEGMTHEKIASEASQTASAITKKLKRVLETCREILKE